MAQNKTPFKKQRWYLLFKKFDLTVKLQLKLHLLRTKAFLVGLIICSILFAVLATLEGISNEPVGLVGAIKTILWFVTVICSWGFWSHVSTVSFTAAQVGPSMANALNGLPVIQGLSSPWNEIKHKEFSKRIAYAMSVAILPPLFLLFFETRGLLVAMIIGISLTAAMCLLAYEVGEYWRPKIEKAILFSVVISIPILLIQGVLTNKHMTWMDLWILTGMNFEPLTNLWNWWYNDLGVFFKFGFAGLVLWLLVNIVTRQKTAGAWGKWFATALVIAGLYSIFSYFQGPSKRPGVKTAQASSGGVVAHTATTPPPNVGEAKKTTETAGTLAGEKEWDFILNAEEELQTALEVMPNTQLRITVTGQVKPDESAQPVSTESGWLLEGNATNVQDFPYPMGRFGQAVLMVNTEVFGLDTRNDIIVNTGGKLIFKVNDRKGYFKGNTGFYKIRVKAL